MKNKDWDKWWPINAKHQHYAISLCTYHISGPILYTLLYQQKRYSMVERVKTALSHDKWQSLKNMLLLWNINIEWKKNYNPTNIDMSYKLIQYLFRVTGETWQTIVAISYLFSYSNIDVKSNIYIIYSNYTFNIIRLRKMYVIWASKQRV